MNGQILHWLKNYVGKWMNSLGGYPVAAKNSSLMLQIVQDMICVMQSTHLN